VLKKVGAPEGETNFTERNEGMRKLLNGGTWENHPRRNLPGLANSGRDIKKKRERGKKVQYFDDYSVSGSIERQRRKTTQLRIIKIGWI